MNGSPIASDLWAFRRSALLPGEAQDALPAGAEPQVEIQFWAAGPGETRSWVVLRAEIQFWVVQRDETPSLVRQDETLPWAALRDETPSLMRQGETRSWAASRDEPPFVASRDGTRSWAGQQGEFRSLVQTQHEMRPWAAWLDEPRSEALSWSPSEVARCCDLRRPFPLPPTGSRARCALLLSLLAWLRQPWQACRDWR
jgi:hypothetical protein